MLVTTQSPGMPGFINAFLKAITITGSIQSVLAFPQPSLKLSSRASFDVPGLGAELEVVPIQYKPLGKDIKDLTGDRREQLKGAIITPIGFGNEHPKDNWAITAELGGTGLPYTELISDGKKNEIGKHGTKKVGDQIFTYMVCSCLDLVILAAYLGMGTDQIV